MSNVSNNPIHKELCIQRGIELADAIQKAGNTSDVEMDVLVKLEEYGIIESAKKLVAKWDSLEGDSEEFQSQVDKFEEMLVDILA